MASSCRFGFVGLMLSLVVGCDSDNRAPQAVDDAATTTAGQAVTVQVLQNDDGSELPLPRIYFWGGK